MNKSLYAGIRGLDQPDSAARELYSACATLRGRTRGLLTRCLAEISDVKARFQGLERLDANLLEATPQGFGAVPKPVLDDLRRLLFNSERAETRFKIAEGILAHMLECSTIVDLQKIRMTREIDINQPSMSKAAKVLRGVGLLTTFDRQRANVPGPALMQLWRAGLLGLSEPACLWDSGSVRRIVRAGLKMSAIVEEKLSERILPEDEIRFLHGLQAICISALGESTPCPGLLGAKRSELRAFSTLFCGTVVKGGKPDTGKIRINNRFAVLQAVYDLTRTREGGIKLLSAVDSKALGEKVQLEQPALYKILDGLVEAGFVEVQRRFGASGRLYAPSERAAGMGSFGLLALYEDFGTAQQPSIARRNEQSYDSSRV